MEAPALLPLEERSPARQKIQLSPRARVPEMSPSQWKAPQLTEGVPGGSSRPLRCTKLGSVGPKVAPSTWGSEETPPPPPQVDDGRNVPHSLTCVHKG